MKMKVMSCLLITGGAVCYTLCLRKRISCWWSGAEKRYGNSRVLPGEY